jgi:hypothetical protein
MKKNLGKILFIIPLIFVRLFAVGVEAVVDKHAIYKGDSVRYTINIEGKNPIFPNISKIAGYDIRSRSSSKSMNSFNGNMKIITSKTYVFYPTRSLNIPSFKVSIDGKEYKTDEIEVRIVEPTASKQGDDFSVDIKTNKSDVYVGEPVRVDVNFRYKVNAKADKIMITPLKANNFWIKKVDKPIESIQRDIVTKTYRYLIFPQKQGDFEIPPIEVNVGTIKVNSGGNFFNDPFFDIVDRTMQWKKLFSNKINVHVKPLPDNLEVYGNFNFKASVDTTEIKANKPVNLTLEVYGEGNIDDIEKFSIDIDEVVAYSDEPKIESSLNGEVYGGKFTQKIALIADRDFIIPALKFKYFDKNSHKVIIKTTKPINIKVKGGKKIDTPIKLDTGKKKIEIALTKENKQIVIKNNDKEFLYLLIGFLMGILVSIGYIKLSFRKNEKKDIPIIKKIKRSKNDRELFDLLIAYGQTDLFIQSILEILEKNIYGKSSIKINKKEIIEHFLELEEG